MITAKDREKEFKEDLKALLKKHGAEIEICDISSGVFGLYQQTIRIMMASVYEPNGNAIIKEYTEFDMGTWIA